MAKNYATSATTTTTVGWVDTIKKSFDSVKIKERILASKTMLLEVGMFLCIGFLSGFLFKKYGKYFIIPVVLGGTLALLQYMGIVTITIHWDQVQAQFGLQPVGGIDKGFIGAFFVWVKKNLAIVISFTVGFFVGTKVA